jgi:hypothetical protein
VSFRYYLYISDNKVDMLLPQIDPGFAVGRRSEISVNLRVLGAKRMTESGRGTDRIARLERVVRHLQDHGDLGSVDEPGQFFGGLLPMRWGQLPGRSHGSLVFFGGRNDRTVLGLGGSARHLIDSAPDAAGPGESRLPALLDGLAASEQEDENVLDAIDELDAADRAALATVRRAVDRMPGPAQNVEFVAKRLLHGPSSVPGDDRSVLLGSPVYVALFD